MGNDFLDMSPKAQATKGKANWTSSKLKTVHQRTQSTEGKEMVRKVCRSPIGEGVKIQNLQRTPRTQQQKSKQPYFKMGKA